jgi:hypothetical protein
MMLRSRNNGLNKNLVAFLTSFGFCVYATLSSFSLSYAIDEDLRTYTTSKSIQGKADSGIKIDQIEAANTLSKKCFFNLSKELETEFPFLAQGTSDKDEMEEEIRIFEEEEAIRTNRIREAEARRAKKASLIATGKTLQFMGKLTYVVVSLGALSIGMSYEDFPTGLLVATAGSLAGLGIGAAMAIPGEKMEKKGKELVVGVDPFINSVKLVYVYRF